MAMVPHSPSVVKRLVCLTVLASMALSGLACSESNGSANANTTSTRAAIAQLPTLADDGGSTCELKESVTSQGGRYSTNVDLTASVALPGESGVDVVMTPKGAIAAVNQGDRAALYWIDPATGEIDYTLDLPDTVSDIAFDGKGILAIATKNKIARLDIASAVVVNEIKLDGVSRVALSPDGFIGVISGQKVHLYDASNTEVFSKVRDYVGVTDVEVRSCGNSQLVYVTSFRNTSFVDLENKRNPVQIARLEALDFTGDVQWSLFSDSADTIKQNVADTRLYRVTLGRDGYLYIGGESAGTATIFRWRGQPMSEEEQYGKTDPFLTRIDEYSQLHNSGAAHLPYYARVHPTEGILVTSQMSFPRLENTKANAMRIGDIAGAADGRLYFGGAAGAAIANRENLTIDGAPVGGYEGCDRAWMSVAPNFKARNFWTVLSEAGGKGIVQGVDAGYGYSAALSNAESGTVPVTRGEQDSAVFLSFTAE
ncbi:MAG: hypothetical protein WA885_24915 [Phormidesmis sp.]